MEKRSWWNLPRKLLIILTRMEIIASKISNLLSVAQVFAIAAEELIGFVSGHG